MFNNYVDQRQLAKARPTMFYIRIVISFNHPVIQVKHRVPCSYPVLVSVASSPGYGSSLHGTHALPSLAVGGVWPMGAKAPFCGPGGGPNEGGPKFETPLSLEGTLASSTHNSVDAEPGNMNIYSGL